MKYILLVITVIITCNTVQAQRRTERNARAQAWDIEKGYVDINSAEDAALNFNRASKCLSNEDSLITVFNILQRVYYFDSTSQLAGRSAHFLDSIHHHIPIQINQRLAGSWRWLGSGSNWGVADSPAKCGCEKRVVFDTQKVYFFELDKEVAAYTYRLVPLSNFFNNNSPKPRWVMHYVIDIQDLNEQWSAHFQKPGFVAGAGTFVNTANAGLLINRQFNCACGCPQEVYEKIIHY